MALKAPRSQFTYFSSIGVLALLIWHQYVEPTEHVSYFSSFFFKFIVIPINVLVTIRIVIRSNYIEAKNGRVTIYREFFTKDSFLIDEIEKVELSASPFSKSFFVLKNGTKISFNDFTIAGGASTLFFKEPGVPLKDI